MYNRTPIKIITTKLIKKIFTTRKTERAETDIIATLCSAINSRYLIEFYYHGGFHLVEPFCSGMLTPADGESLLRYQTSGHSEFGEPVGWKLFRVSEILELKILKKHVTGTRPEYNPDKFKWSAIYCCAFAGLDVTKQGRTTTPIPHSNARKNSVRTIKKRLPDIH